MKASWTVLASVLYLAWPGLAVAQSDFDRYVEEIRRSGVTEQAASQLRTVASILAGSTAFTATRGPDGEVGHSYRSTMCFIPTDSEKIRGKQEALRRELAAKQETWIAFLKKQADTDASGFVTTEEGWALRRRFELGLILAQLEEIKNADQLGKAVGQDPAAALSDLAAYAALRNEAVKQNLEGFPEPRALE